MGGRGANFTRKRESGGGSNNTAKKTKAKRGQYAAWKSNDEAWDLLKSETGFNNEQTDKVFDNMIEYFGGDYKSFTNGQESEATAVIDNALNNMGAYDGVIYRGVKLNHLYMSQKEINDYINNTLKVGNEAPVTKYSGVLSSWSNSQNVANAFSGKSSDIITSIIYVCKNNKSAVGVQHISHFGAGEAEVLAPSTTKWKIVNKTVTKKAEGYSKSYGQTYNVVVEVEEQG